MGGIDRPNSLHSLQLLQVPNFPQNEKRNGKGETLISSQMLPRGGSFTLKLIGQLPHCDATIEPCLNQPVGITLLRVDVSGVPVRRPGRADPGASPPPIVPLPLHLLEPRFPGKRLTAPARARSRSVSSSSTRPRTAHVRRRAHPLIFLLRC